MSYIIRDLERTIIESKSGGRSPTKSIDSFRDKYKPDLTS